MKLRTISVQKQLQAQYGETCQLVLQEKGGSRESKDAEEVVSDQLVANHYQYQRVHQSHLFCVRCVHRKCTNYRAMTLSLWQTPGRLEANQLSALGTYVANIVYIGATRAGTVWHLTYVFPELTNMVRKSATRLVTNAIFVRLFVQLLDYVDRCRATLAPLLPKAALYESLSLLLRTNAFGIKKRMLHENVIGEVEAFEWWYDQFYSTPTPMRFARIPSRSGAVITWGSEANIFCPQ